MHILCLGLNHTTAPLELREKLAFRDEIAYQALADFACSNAAQQLKEIIIISTCNRTEIYSAGNTSGFSELESILSAASGVPVRGFHKSLYRYQDETAADHLYRVSTGLDSLVIGEPQILGQVTHSLELALQAGSCGTVLSNLFRSAIHAGKRARSETGISRNAASISSLAAALAEKEVKDLSVARVVVIGAGEMAELAVEAMRKRGAVHITVVNRTLKKAQELADRWQASAFTFGSLGEWLVKADIVISSTSAPHPIIAPDKIKEIMAQRKDKTLVMVDIAVPRNIDPAVSAVAGVRLFDLDTLEQKVKQLMAARTAEVPFVEAILEEEKAQFMEFFKTMHMLPLITELHIQAETIRHQELERTLHRLPDLTEAERKRIDAMTRALVKKLLASPTQRLRIEAACPHAGEYSMVARTLFDLPCESELCAFSNEICSVRAEAACPERSA